MKYDKKIKILLIICLTVFCNINTILAETEVKHNYKVQFESNTEFGQQYGWVSGTQAGKPYPAPPMPTATYVSNGKYGKGFKLTNPGFYTEEMYGIAWRMAFLPSVTPKAGGDSIPFVDYMKEVTSINIWVKTPYSSFLEGKTRKIKLQLETNAGKYTCITYVSNTGDWHYVMMPINSFTSGIISYSDRINEITEVKALVFEVPNDTTYFGRKPDKPVLNQDGTYSCPTWLEPWDEPMIFDELVFDRSTPEKPAITLPSIGCDDDFSNANLAGVQVGEQYIPVESDVIDIPMPGYTAIVTQEDVIGVPVIENIFSGADAFSVTYTDKQIQTGATCEFTPPDTFPGTGKMLVTAANGLTIHEYILNFYKGNPLSITRGSINGIEHTGNLTSGVKSLKIPVSNDGEKTLSVAIVGIVQDKETGQVHSVGYVNENSLECGMSKILDLSLTVPVNPEKYIAKLFIWDDMTNLNRIKDTFTFGN